MFTRQPIDQHISFFLAQWARGPQQLLKDNTASFLSGGAVAQSRAYFHFPRNARPRSALSPHNNPLPPSCLRISAMLLR